MKSSTKSLFICQYAVIPDASEYRSVLMFQQGNVLHIHPFDSGEKAAVLQRQ